MRKVPAKNKVAVLSASDNSAVSLKSDLILDNRLSSGVDHE